MIFEALQSELVRFDFHLLRSKLKKKTGIQPNHHKRLRNQNHSQVRPLPNEMPKIQPLFEFYERPFDRSSNRFMDPVHGPGSWTPDLDNESGFGSEEK